MASGTNIRTYFDGAWHDGNIPIMRAADHGSWLGSTVFDGARQFEGLVPDLRAHCARLNASASALSITPTVSNEDLIEITLEGLKAYSPDQPVYIRPMYWTIDGDPTIVAPAPNSTGFAICLEEVPMPAQTASATLTRTQFRRPVIEDALVNAKAGSLYPNNSRMLQEARRKGFSNALVADALGNVAESATSNVFMVKDAEVFTPIPNGTFLSGITRARHIDNMRKDGIKVHETTLSFDDFLGADEVFLSGNLAKVTPVSAFEDTQYEIGPLTRRVRELYWDWAHSTA